MDNVNNSTIHTATLYAKVTTSWGARLSVGLLLAIIYFMMTSGSAYAIVGGTEASEGHQEWMVGIALASETDGFYAQFCGGTLIDSQWVLTAAHCTVDENNSPFSVGDIDIIVGRTRLSSQQGERIAIDRIIVHEGFDLVTYDNDIALLHLASPVQSVEPIRIVDATDLSTLKNQFSLASNADFVAFASVYGWGLTGDGYASDALMNAELPLVSGAKCQSSFDGYDIRLSDNMMCAGFVEGGIDSCVGDSGGPLVMQHNDEAVQIGLVSWGLECGAAGLYGVYTNVTNYTEWISFQQSFYR